MRFLLDSPNKLLRTIFYRDNFIYLVVLFIELAALLVALSSFKDEFYAKSAASFAAAVWLHMVRSDLDIRNPNSDESKFEDIREMAEELKENKEKLAK